MKFLISTTEVHRVGTQGEVDQMIEEAKQDNNFVLTKYSTEVKEVKEKKEVVDTYYKVTLVKSFTDIKEPEFQTKITYEVE